MPPTDQDIAEFSGTFINDLHDQVKLAEKKTADLLSVAIDQERADKSIWCPIFFTSGGFLVIEPWEIIIRVRQAICRGAANDGRMSPGGVQSWFDLERLQNQLMLEDFES